MSKQLLHLCRSHAIVVALNDRAFAVIRRDGGSWMNDGVSNDDDLIAVALELLLSSSSSVDGKTKNSNPCEI